MYKANIFAFADEASPMIDEQIQAMKRNSLLGLEIRSVDGENVSSISMEKAKEVHSKMQNAGLTVWSIGSPIGKIDIEKDDFNQHLDVLKRTIDIARILECGNIRMFSFYLPREKQPSLFRNEVMDRLHKMAEVSEGSGVQLCHENEKGIYGDIAVRCHEILSEIPEIGGIFDPANFVQCGQDTMEAWKMLKPRIKYLHIKDAMFADGSVVPAGKGEGNVPFIVKDFLTSGGTSMTVEPHLTVFSGLNALERAGEESKIGGHYAYANSQEAFDAACAALRDILEK